MRSQVNSRCKVIDGMILVCLTIFLCLFTLMNYFSVQHYLNIQIMNLTEKIAIITLVLHVVQSIVKKEKMLIFNWPMFAVVFVFIIGMTLVSNVIDPVYSQEIMREFFKAIIFYILISNVIKTLTDYKV